MLSLFKRQVAVTGAPLMRVSFSSGFTALKKAEKDATKTTKTTKPPKTGKAGKLNYEVQGLFRLI